MPSGLVVQQHHVQDGRRGKAGRLLPRRLPIPALQPPRLRFRDRPHPHHHESDEARVSRPVPRRLLRHGEQGVVGRGPRRRRLLSTGGIREELRGGEDNGAGVRGCQHASNAAVEASGRGIFRRLDRQVGALRVRRSTARSYRERVPRHRHVSDTYHGGDRGNRGVHRLKGGEVMKRKKRGRRVNRRVLRYL